MIYVCHVPGYKLWNEPEKLKNILEDLEKYKNKIVGIEFSHNSIGEQCAKALGEKMKNLKNLRKVNLDDCFVSRGGKELPESLKYLLDSIADKSIKELNLSDNALGPVAEKGYEFFFKNNKTLEKLYLNNNGMGTLATQNLMKILIANVNMPLKVLRISRNKMENDGCLAVCDLLKAKEKTLNELVISDNEIKNEGIGSLFEAIKNNKNLKLKLLHIQNNTLSNKINDVLDALPTLINIENLDLSDLNIDSKQNEIKELFNILPRLPKLKVFHFEYNLDIENKKKKNSYFTELMDILLKINTLKEICLSNNGFPKELYDKYSKLFKEKKIYICCYSQEEKEEDIDNDDLEKDDLNKN